MAAEQRIKRRSFMDTPPPKRRNRLAPDDSDLYPKLICFLIGVAVGIFATGMYVHHHLAFLR